MKKRVNTKLFRDSDFNFDRSKFLRMDANERIIPYSKKEISLIKKSINNYFLQAYPTFRSGLKNKISKKENINKNNLCLTPGIDAVLKYIFELYTSKKTSILTIYPTYGLIDVYAKIYDLKIKKIDEENLKNLDNISNYKNTSLVYIANPNSPSGTEISKKIIEKVCKITNKKKIPFICDETYIEYSNIYSAKNLISKYSNLIVLRTFSKFVGLAGIRLAYMISKEKNIELINKIRPPHDLSFIAISIVNTLYKEKFLNNYKKQILDSKKEIKKMAKKRNLRISLKGGNFFHIFIDAKFNKKLVNFLKKKKVLVKSSFSKDHGAPYKGNKDSLRVSIGSVIQMRFFFNLLDKGFKQI
jgi:histidinol-phosphate aminotransferase